MSDHQAPEMGVVRANTKCTRIMVMASASTTMFYVGKTNIKAEQVLQMMSLRAWLVLPALYYGNSNCNRDKGTRTSSSLLTASSDATYWPSQGQQQQTAYQLFNMSVGNCFAKSLLVLPATDWRQRTSAERAVHLNLGSPL